MCSGWTPGGALPRRLAPNTACPDAASSPAVAAPMPDDAPVTSTTGRRTPEARGPVTEPVDPGRLSNSLRADAWDQSPT